jgi:hypothetical protein
MSSRFNSGRGHHQLTQLHVSTVSLADRPALARFLSTVPNSEGLAQLLLTQTPQNTRAFDDDEQVARFVISDGAIVTCFTVESITIDQAELITLACEEADTWDEASFRQAVAHVVGVIC